jgi:hypothetical protein
LKDQYKGSDRKNSQFHNRLSDFIHSGFALDDKNQETFEVRNELESAAVFRIRPNWNTKQDIIADWAFVGNVSW